MAQVHLIAQKDKFGFWYLGCEWKTGEPVWIHQDFIGAEADKYGLLAYDHFEDAHESAKKIGDGAFATTISY